MEIGDFMKTFTFKIKQKHNLVTGKTLDFATNILLIETFIYNFCYFRNRYLKSIKITSFRFL